MEFHHRNRFMMGGFVAGQADDVIKLPHWGGRSFCLRVLPQVGKKLVNWLSLVGDRSWVGNELVQLAIRDFVRAVSAERRKIALRVGEVLQEDHE